MLIFCHRTNLKAFKLCNFAALLVTIKKNQLLNLLIYYGKISSAAFTDTKPHYDLLDGLRGVAALMVIWYHVFEGFAFASAGNIETLNHGYLAVDFFLFFRGLLSVMRMMTVGGRISL